MDVRAGSEFCSCCAWCRAGCFLGVLLAPNDPGLRNIEHDKDGQSPSPLGWRRAAFRKLTCELYAVGQTKKHCHSPFHFHFLSKASIRYWARGQSCPLSVLAVRQSKTSAWAPPVAPTAGRGNVGGRGWAWCARSGRAGEETISQFVNYATPNVKFM